MAKKQDLAEIVELVFQTLEQASEYGLEAEIIATAMQKLQKNPDMDISVALQSAMIEWDI
jgi:hypothetical protein